jgi:ubiquinone/menaquinone biosynthesis C-methylase UbiE
MFKLWWRLVRFGFRLLYNEMAFTYDGVSNIVSLGAWRCWGRAALKHLHVEPGKRVLELAHGTGNLQLDLITAGYRTIGYDLSSYMGHIAKAKLRERGYPINLIRGKAQQLPFLDEAFAAVVSTFPTDFIFQAETLREVYRVLQTDGQFIIVPNGVLTGRSLSSTGIEWLYRITGQRGNTTSNVADFFATYGFNIELTTEACPRSIAQIILARKKG